MTEPRLDQLYCTHCTYRTSALHRREGASGDQVFEETTRAGSVPREKSHEIYSRFASCLLFRVPGDMPSEAMIKHTAHSLQLRRLVYMPTVGGYRLLTQVCFRQTDTRGRPGASFAHVIIQDLKENPQWSALDALRQWGSKKWVIEDRPDLPFDLLPFRTLRDFTVESESSINDEVLSSFLTADSEFHDPGKLIPSRWLQQSPETRQKLLTNLVQAVLNLDLDRREQLLLVAEPSVAALLFYGVFRLLPPMGVVDKLSFSTYESHKDRMMTTLAATCFHDPVATDLPPDWYTPHARGVAFNTFKADRHTPLKKQSQYAARIVKKFVEEGPPAIDEFRQICGQLEIGKPSELEGLSAIDGLVADLLSPKTKEELAQLEQGLPKEPGLRAYLRQKLVDSFSLDDDNGHLPMLFENPPHAMLIFRLLTEAGADQNSRALEPVVQTMLAHWPNEALGAFLRDKDVSKDRKLSLLLPYVEDYGALPPDAEALFFTRGSVCSKEKLLEELLRQLHGEKLREFLEFTYESCHKEECFCELLRALAPLTDSAEHQRTFQGLFSHPRFQNDPAERTQMINAVLADKGLRDKLAKAVHFECDQIAAHLKQMLLSLHRSPGQLDHNLELLEALKHFILEDRGRLSNWHTVANQLKQLQQLNSVPQGILSRLIGSSNKSENVEAAKALAFAAKKAIPATGEYEDNRPTLVYNLVKSVVGDAGLPEGLHAGLQGVFSRDVWPSRQAHKRGLESAFSIKAVAIASAVLLVAILGLAALQQWPALSPFPQVAGTDSTNPISSNTVDAAQDLEKARLEEEAKNKSTVEKNKAKDEKLKREREEADEKVKEKFQKKDEKRVASTTSHGNKTLPNAAGAESVMPEADPSKVAKPDVDSTETRKKQHQIIIGSGKPMSVNVKWPPFYDLGEIKSTAPTPKPPDGGAKAEWAVSDIIANSGLRFSKLQDWPTDEGITLTVNGLNELNSYLAGNRNKDLQRKRLVFQNAEVTSQNNVKSLCILEIPSDAFDRWDSNQDLDLTKLPSGLLCVFQFRSDGLYFAWAKPENRDPSRLELQKMVRLCCLRVENQKQPIYINLISVNKIFSKGQFWSAYTFTKDPRVNETTFSFQTELEGMAAFKWIVSDGAIIQESTRDQFKLHVDAESIEIDPDSHEISLEDKELATKWLTDSQKLPCDTVRFIQVYDPLQRKLIIKILPEWSIIELESRGERLDEVKSKLMNALDSIESNCKPPPKAAPAPAAPTPATPAPAVSSTYEPQSDIAIVSREAEELRAIIKSITKVDQKNDPPVLQTDKAAPNAKELLYKFAISSRSYWSNQVEKAEKAVANQIKVIKTIGEDGLNSHARERVKKFKRVEVHELKRLVGNSYVSIFANSDKP